MTTNDDRRAIAGILARGFDEHMEVHGPDGSYAVRDGRLYEVTERDGASVARVFYLGRYYSVRVTDDGPVEPEARPDGIPDVPDARPYAGYRHCLYCQSRARWDIAGFLACYDTEHAGRAAEALARHRAKQDGGQ